jgi:ABC-type transport system involved in multi-copper enzyme maturation permease subunit
MLALFFKDWRFFRVPMIALVVLSIGCYVIGFTAIATLKFNANSGSTKLIFGPSVLNIIFTSCLATINLTALLASAFGGICIAGERNDRTADFLAMLPITRGQIVTSKWLVSFVILGCWAGVHAIIALSLFTHKEYFSSNELEISQSAAVWGGFSFCFYGVAWLFSTFTRSGPISACASIALTLSCAGLTALCMDSISRSVQAVPLGVGFVTFVVGLASLFVGTVYYVKRVAP